MSEQQSEKGDVHLRGVCISTICISISFRLCLLPFSEVMSTPSSLQLHFAQSWFLTQFVLLPTSSCFVPHDILLCSLCSILACLFFIYSLYCCSSVILRFCSRTCRQHILTKQKPLQFLWPTALFYYKKKHRPLIPLKAGADCLPVSIAYKCLCVVTLRPELGVRFDSCEKGAASDGKTCISRSLKAPTHLTSLLRKLLQKLRCIFQETSSLYRGLNNENKSIIMCSGVNLSISDSS